LVESCGFAKEKDLLAFLIDGDYRLPEWMDSLAGRIAGKKGIRIRPFRPKDEDAEFALIKELYNDSWSANWGFVPLSDEEMREIQKSVMTFADPDLAFFIYYEDEPAAFCVIFPDINPLLKRLNGRIGLLGLLKALLYRREITGLRCLLCGKRTNTVLWSWAGPWRTMRPSTPWPWKRAQDHIRDIAYSENLCNSASRKRLALHWRSGHVG
jgi:hypothetical protein